MTQKLKSAAEKAKIELSSQTTATIYLPAIGEGKEDIDLEITRKQFEALLKPWLIGSRSDGGVAFMELVRKTVEKSHLTPDDIDSVLLVGGSTRIPMVSEILSREFGKGKVLKSVDPSLCVAHGGCQSGTSPRSIGPTCTSTA